MQKEHYNIAPRSWLKAKFIRKGGRYDIGLFTILIASYGHSARIDIAAVEVATISLCKW